MIEKTVKNRSFWRRKTLREMTENEWESLCDRCGLCCLHKLEDEDTGDLYFTNVACRLLDLETCQCTNYANRMLQDTECIKLNSDEIESCPWLPVSCAYRRVASGRGLPAWHPLRTGDAESVHRAGISPRGCVVSEDEVDDWEDHITGMAKP